MCKLAMFDFTHGKDRGEYLLRLLYNHYHGPLHKKFSLGLKLSAKRYGGWGQLAKQMVNSHMMRGNTQEEFVLSIEPDQFA